MRAGTLRHRVTIQVDNGDGTDGIQGAAATWTDVKRVWASIETLTGREYFHAAQAQAEATCRIRMRHNGVNITERHRISWTDTNNVTRVFGIEHVNRVGGREIEYELMAKELRA